ncbi:reactive intermediate/imine deaminase [Suicoccus acidiformans]|uniref:Reactive intermediate/imine deaminase n=1 Tax=Suicoccus acidiformans TaxID=2036206 RepID=A0A347WLU6_9LACT|nr:RidA family protein [Suicoccus acidiformans]AXY26053.1 reactive intermediate/imine deaminase [Suicoccus acidiformans]
MKKELNSPLAPEALGPYSQGIRVGDLIFLSGQLGIDQATGELAEGVVAQTEQAFRNIQHVLESDSLSLDNIVKVTVLLADINDFATVNEVYAKHFNEPYPARSAFAVKDIPKGARVEIEVIAHAN